MLYNITESHVVIVSWTKFLYSSRITHLKYFTVKNHNGVECFSSNTWNIIFSFQTLAVESAIARLPPYCVLGLYL